MKVTEGITWILVPTPRFQESLAFFRDIMGLPVVEEGVPVTDTQFSRYAQIKLPNGAVLEIVEPKETVAQLYHAPVVSITVDDVARARHELEERRSSLSRRFLTRGKDGAGPIFRRPMVPCISCRDPYRGQRHRQAADQPNGADAPAVS